MVIGLVISQHHLSLRSARSYSAGLDSDEEEDAEDAPVGKSKSKAKEKTDKEKESRWSNFERDYMEFLTANFPGVFTSFRRPSGPMFVASLVSHYKHTSWSVVCTLWLICLTYVS